LRIGEIKARKVRGPRALEWRVKVSALEAFGYHRRESTLQAIESSPQDGGPDLEAALRNLQSLQGALTAEVRRCAKQQHKLEVMHQQVTSLIETLTARRLLQ
jgi:hypothetical protein